MGRIKTQLIKRASKEFIEKNKDKIKDNFEDNKKVVQNNAEIGSKKLRNIMAGYVTRLKKKDKMMFND